MILSEGLDYQDMKGQLEPKVSIDEYAAKMGPDSDVVTLSFVVKSKLAGDDLTAWFERGYDYVLDASVSEGELSPGKYVVFVEMDRRSTVPARVVNLVRDLETLTQIPVKDWEVQIDNKTYPLNEKIIRKLVILNPNLYKTDEEKENTLNEYRERAGITPKPVVKVNLDPELKNFISAAGL